ncbi:MULTISPECIES: glycogen synthase [Clostridium]|uniref:glycogen synthase n=2 Tax=Clostridiaceae TaxID=31979 RepID=UPI0006BEFCAD|nr:MULTISPECIES: glycogen/starch synthase [Clostridium]MDU7452784.1 glycogen/starch synthase [Clostridium saudiense]CUO24786.1 glycogen/starch synthase [Clostridium disporicum]SCJ99743.1 Glycogen synthase [uncultured Clostridium sp.]
MKKILFVASESVPFIKTGGLADVVGSLPKSFPKEEFDVRVVIPNYTCIPWEYRSDFKYITHFYMDLGQVSGSEYVGVLTTQYDGITFYFIDNQRYFGGNTPYGDTRFDIEKFCFFSKAALSILPSINFKPDIIHCHDWQTGVLPVYLHTIFRDNNFYDNIKTIMTIHNLRFQGIWDIKTLQKITNFPDYVFRPTDMEYNKDANMLKGGMVYANYITTVSNSYKNEIQNDYYGEGLDGVVRQKSGDLYGILNGIDYNEYNPETDNEIFSKYNKYSFIENKLYNKRGLQHELGLEQNDNKFMIGIISRLTDQKGVDLIARVIEEIVDDHTQLVVLGTGDKGYEDMFRYYEWKLKGKVSGNIYFSNNRAHKIYAAADAMLVPSRFEPCGLTQLISLRYGTVPIVRETGGLRDTVEPFNIYSDCGTGFSFANYNAHEMLNTINYAKHIYFNNRDKWNGIAFRGMEKDYSWGNSAQDYAGLYRKLMGEW